MDLKILDCTLRDGGYYTNWDFSKEVVNEYIHATNILPIDYLELGYRNKPSKEYLGMYGYCPVFILRQIRELSTKKIAIMLNAKSVEIDDLDCLLDPIKGLVDMVRMAVDPKDFERALALAKEIKAKGFEVGFNTMYMSKWAEYEGFLPMLKGLDGIVDVFNMVDSYGGVTPMDVKEITLLVKKYTSVPVGFHGHNNLQLGLINTLSAIECGAQFADATILGMGRGAGNLKMELLLTYLNKHTKLEVDFNILGNVISAFTPLLDKYQWGTNLPYMLSGANSLPQKDVMDWVSNRVYSFNSIVRALDNRRGKVQDNAKFPELICPKFDKVIIIGGGANAIDHLEGIKAYIQSEQSIALVHATAKNASLYKDLDVPQYYGLVGSEGKRLTSNVGPINFKGICLLPPYPRTMGTEVPEFAKDSTFELREIDFTTEYHDSCTTIALQSALLLSKGNIFIVGYDGYPGSVLSEKEMALTNENRVLFQDFQKAIGHKLVSLTPTLYKELEVISIYQFV